MTPGCGLWSWISTCNESRHLFYCISSCCSYSLHSSTCMSVTNLCVCVSRMRPFEYTSVRPLSVWAARGGNVILYIHMLRCRSFFAGRSGLIKPVKERWVTSWRCEISGRRSLYRQNLLIKPRDLSESESRYWASRIFSALWVGPFQLSMMNRCVHLAHD